MNLIDEISLHKDQVWQLTLHEFLSWLEHQNRTATYPTFDQAVKTWIATRGD